MAIDKLFTAIGLGMGSFEKAAKNVKFVEVDLHQGVKTPCFHAYVR